MDINAWVLCLLRFLVSVVAMACACFSQTTGSVSAWSSGTIVAFPPNVPGPLVTHPSLQVCTAHTRVLAQQLELFIYFEGRIHFRLWDRGAARMLPAPAPGQSTLGGRSFPQEAQLGAEPEPGHPLSSWTLHKGVRFKSSHRPIF